MTRKQAKTFKIAVIVACLLIAAGGGYVAYRYSAEKPVAKLHFPPAKAVQPPPPAPQNVPPPENPETGNKPAPPNTPSPVAPPSEAPKSAEKTPQPAPRARLGQVLGRLEIPRLHISVPVIEGTDERQLKRGAGHVPSTALPGPSGNVALAAHRDKYFRPLRNIRAHDKITLDTPGGKFTYVVRKTEIVSPKDVAVLHPTPDPELTLITCYPFYYVGHAPKRFIVHAAAAPELNAAHTGAQGNESD